MKSDIIKIQQTWNYTYLNLYDRAKNIIKKNATKAFYNEKEHVYLETDVLSVGLGTSLHK